MEHDDVVVVGAGLASPAGRELHLASDEVEYRVGRMGRLYRWWLDAAVANPPHTSPMRPGPERSCARDWRPSTSRNP